MCRFASFKFKPAGKVAVRVAGSLDSHHEIPGDDGDRPNGWREGHYLPCGTIQCRTLDFDKLSGLECEAILKARWPTFAAFFAWALKKTDQEKVWNGSLYLGSLTSAAGLTLPEKIGGWLYLDSLTSAAGLTLPKKIGGSLYLGGRKLSLAEATAEQKEAS